VPKIGDHRYRSDKFGYTVVAIRWTGDWEGFRTLAAELGFPVEEFKPFDNELQIPAAGATLANLTDPDWIGVGGRRHGNLSKNCWAGIRESDGAFCTWGEELFNEVFFGGPPVGLG